MFVCFLNKGEEASLIAKKYTGKHRTIRFVNQTKKFQVRWNENIKNNNFTNTFSVIFENYIYILKFILMNEIRNSISTTCSCHGSGMVHLLKKWNVQKYSQTIRFNMCNLLYFGVVLKTKFSIIRVSPSIVRYNVESEATRLLLLKSP